MTRENEYYTLFKVDSRTGTILNSSFLAGALSEDHVLIPAEDMVYLGTIHGLYLLDIQQNAINLVEIQANSSNESRIKYMYRSLHGDMIIIGAEEGSFVSYGLNSPWVQLHAFENNLPNTISKMIVYDTSTAMLIQDEDYCGHKQAYLLNKTNSQWKKLHVPVNVQNLQVLFKNQNRLFVKPDYCDLLYLEDDSPIYKSLVYKGKTFSNLFKAIDGSLIGSLFDYNSSVETVLSLDNALSFQPFEWKPTNYSLTSGYTIPDKVSFLFFENDTTDMVFCYRSTINKKEWELRSAIHNANLKGMRH